MVDETVERCCVERTNKAMPARRERRGRRIQQAFFFGQRQTLMKYKMTRARARGMRKFLRKLLIERRRSMRETAVATMPWTMRNDTVAMLPD